MRRTFHYFGGHQVHFWSRDWVLTIFFIEKNANIYETHIYEAPNYYYVFIETYVFTCNLDHDLVGHSY